jgi:hypothetical protein
MKKFDGTIKEFISSITNIKKGYLKKPNGKKIEGLWWEESDPNKYHLMNICEKNLNARTFDETETRMITKDEVEHRVELYLSWGYEMYL